MEARTETATPSLDDRGQRHAHDHGPRDGASSVPCCEGAGTLGCAPDARAVSPLEASCDRRVFRVRGLDCAEEIATLRKAVGPLVGGPDALAFDVLNGRMIVAASVPATDQEIAEMVARTGMTADRSLPDAPIAKDRGGDRRWQTAFTILSGLAIASGFAFHTGDSGGISAGLRLFASHAAGTMPWPEMLAYTLAIAFGGRYVAVKAWYALKRLSPDMNLLMTVAVFGAIGIGEWFEAATVAFLFSLSLALESWSIQRARKAIANLLDLAPPTVRMRKPTGEEVALPAAQALVGTRFIVRPGDRIALDGKILAGESAINEAPITGESVPAAKGPGAVVFAGTVNGEGTLEIESTRLASDTTLARIIRLVEEAHGRRASSEQWVEKFARVYTPAVMTVAMIIAAIPPLFLGEWAEWLYRALVLLVIACPCALVISTPVSIVSAMAAAARNGVLIKGGSFIELPARIRAIAFDKTGTLTQGRPAVLAVTPLNGHSKDELIARAAALEIRATHPVAGAILDYAKQYAIVFSPADNVKVMHGKGMTGSFCGEELWLGSHRYLEERGQETPALHDQAEALASAGHTVIVLGNESHVCGLVAVSDPIRENARATVNALKSQGIGHIAMLTGDNRSTAERIARDAAIDEVRADLLPEDKVFAIESLVKAYGTVAMVGDGINDAPAMARASIGIAMGAAGSDAAIETADIALMADDIGKLPWLIAHSRRTLRIVRQNIGFALGVKALFVVLTFAGVATLWGAIAADVGASLLVVTNALRLLNARAACP